MKFLLSILLFPILMFADINEEYSELFSQSLVEEKFEECEEILRDWEENCTPGIGQISALKASLLFCKGEMEKGEVYLEEAFNNIPEIYLSSFTKSIIRKMVEQSPLLALTAKNISYPHITLCKRKQPKGLSFRYWFGVAQVVVGCVVAPFNPPAGGGLIATGVSTIVHASADCLDNMEKWEREERERQKIGEEKSF